MKKILLFVLLCCGFLSGAQSVNDYRYVVIPNRFEMQTESNQYRLNTIAKKLLTEAGFTAYYESMLPDELVNKRCDNLYMDFVKVKSMLKIKGKITLTDCRGKVVFESAEGNSRSKEYKVGYPEAFQEAFESLKALQYQYNGKVQSEAVSSTAGGMNRQDQQRNEVQAPASSASSASSVVYSVEELANGYLVIDPATSRIALKILKTADPKIYTASNHTAQGVFINKGGKWFFEYYKDEKLYSEEYKVNHNL